MIMFGAKQRLDMVFYGEKLVKVMCEHCRVVSIWGHCKDKMELCANGLNYLTAIGRNAVNSFYSKIFVSILIEPVIPLTGTPDLQSGCLDWNSRHSSDPE